MGAAQEKVGRGQDRTREVLVEVFDTLAQKLLRTPTDNELCNALMHHRILTSPEEYRLFQSSCSGTVELHTVNDKILIGAARTVGRQLNRKHITYRAVSDFCYENFRICVPPLALRTLMQPCLRELESQSGITISKDVYSDSYVESELRSSIGIIYKRVVRNLRGEGISRDPFLQEVEDLLRVCSIIPGENRLRREIQNLQKTQALPLQLSTALSRDVLERSWWKISNQGKLAVTTRELSLRTGLSVNTIQKLFGEINRERIKKSLTVISIDSTPESKLDRSLILRAHNELSEERGMPPTGGELRQRYERIAGSVDVGVRQVIKTIEIMTKKGFPLSLRGKSGFPDEALERAFFSLHSHLGCAPTMAQLEQTLTLFVPELNIGAEGIKARVQSLRKKTPSPSLYSLRSGEGASIHSPLVFFQLTTPITPDIFNERREALRQQFFFDDPIYVKALDHARALITLQREAHGPLPLLTRLVRSQDPSGAYLFRSGELRILLGLAINHGFPCIQKKYRSAAEPFATVVQALTTSPGASIWQSDPRFYLTPLLSRWVPKMNNEAGNLSATPLGAVETILSFLVLSPWGLHSENLTDPKSLAKMFYGDAERGESPLSRLEMLTLPSSLASTSSSVIRQR